MKVRATRVRRPDVRRAVRMRYPMEAPGGCQTRRRAIGSAGERLVHTEEVTGSIPVSPTRSVAMSIFVGIAGGAIPVAKCQRLATLPAMAGRLAVVKTAST